MLFYYALWVEVARYNRIVSWSLFCAQWNMLGVLYYTSSSSYLCGDLHDIISLSKCIRLRQPERERERAKREQNEKKEKRQKKVK